MICSWAVAVSWQWCVISSMLVTRLHLASQRSLLEQFPVCQFVLMMVEAVFCVEQLYSYRVCRNATISYQWTCSCGSWKLSFWKVMNMMWYHYGISTVIAVEPSTKVPTDWLTCLLICGTHCIILFWTTVNWSHIMLLLLLSLLRALCNLFWAAANSWIVLLAQ